MSELPTPLRSIVEDFQAIEGQEKLEYLLELAQRLPPLPDRVASQRENMDVVHECMTPVFIHAEKGPDSHVDFYLDVAEESPTVRGYATILQEGLSGATLDEILAVPLEFYLELGLQEVLSAQRLNGIGAILAHMKRMARQAQ